MTQSLHAMPVRYLGVYSEIIKSRLSIESILALYNCPVPLMASSLVQHTVCHQTFGQEMNWLQWKVFSVQSHGPSLSQAICCVIEHMLPLRSQHRIGV